MIILVSGITKGHTSTETDTLQCYPDPKMVLPTKYPTPTVHYVHMIHGKFIQNNHLLWQWIFETSWEKNSLEKNSLDRVLQHHNSEESIDLHTFTCSSYYDHNLFNKLTQAHKQQFSIMSTNIQSLNAKIDKLKAFGSFHVNSTNFDKSSQVTVPNIAQKIPKIALVSIMKACKILGCNSEYFSRYSLSNFLFYYAVLHSRLKWLPLKYHIYTLYKDRGLKLAILTNCDPVFHILLSE